MTGTTEDLRRFAMFKTISTADLEALARLTRRRQIARNALIFRRGDPGEWMMLICAGEARIFLNDEQGNEITFRTLGEGQILGEFSLLDHKNRTASAAANAPLDVLVLQRVDFLRLLQERPVVGIELMRGFAERIRYATTYLGRLNEALERLSNSEYEEAIRDMALSTDEAGMQALINTFVAMVHSLQERLPSDPKK
ncbi:MAG TPA: cyclic nucleotide-binding domain-containing protein [Phototrophicaceae bacterium]|nr:cyclic nucleotide-binding domain-containing protein [Phototrophicaceae bacterium]